MSEKMKGNTHFLGHTHSESEKKRISERNIRMGIKPSFKGRRHTKESKEKMSIASTKALCKRGHKFSGDNLYLWHGLRVCIECRNIRQQLGDKMKKRALVLGATGQDGSFLCELLLNKGYETHGLMRRSSSFNTSRLDHIFDQLHMHHGDLTDGSGLNALLSKVKFDELYNLSAQSHVRVSFDCPEYSCDVDALWVRLGCSKPHALIAQRLGYIKPAVRKCLALRLHLKMKLQHFIQGLHMGALKFFRITFA